MESTSFLSALLAIIVIDLVLAGDNAIVIALAARSLPAALRKRAIVWGAVGAIAVRSAMTLVVVWLLAIPGLLLVGGALLVWIAYRLLLPESGDRHDGPAPTTFWGAMRTIVVADAVMGLDNVLAVAGAAHGSYLLVVTGLVISVPIVVWGSTLVLRIVERYPVVVYVGAGVLAWTAVKMMLAEPLLRAPLAALPPVTSTLAYAVVVLVLWLGFVKNHRQLESRIHARLSEFSRQRPVTPPAAPSHSPRPPVPTEGAPSMLKVLVPVDGSPNALRAVRHAMSAYRRDHALELHLLNVQPRLSRHVARFIARGDREAWHREQAADAMRGSRELLDRAGVPYETHWALGDRAVQICRSAHDLGIHHIVMGTARKNSITRMLEDSTTHQVLETTPVPVEVVAGEAVSKWERWGLPAGVAGVGGLLLMAAID